MPEIVIREYFEDDLQKVINLYHQKYQKTPAFYRSVDYFNYIKSYPGVTKDGILLALENDIVLGVIIISIIQSDCLSGRIIELRTEKLKIREALISKAIEYCQQNGVVKIEINATGEYPYADNIFNNWIKVSQNGALMARPISISTLLLAFFNGRIKHDTESAHNYLFHLENETFLIKWAANRYVIDKDIKNTNHSRYTKININSHILFKIMVGFTNPYIALLSGKIKITPIKDVCKMLSVLFKMKLNDPWNIEIADER